MWHDNLHKMKILSLYSFESSPELHWKTFTQFSKLPTELQDKIWTYALPGPRIIGVQIKRFKDVLEDDSVVEFYSFIEFYKCVTVEPHPELLHACRNSRAVALDTYRLSFVDELRHPVYFDIRRDVLSFDRFDMLCFFFQLCDNVYTFTEGRIPTLLLDLGERHEDWFDVDMFLDIWRNDFLYKQTKFGLVDEIVVLNREQAAATASAPEAAINALNDYLADILCQIKNMNKYRQGYMLQLPVIRLPNIISLTQEELLERQSQK